jgi:TRAP-type C4-dicarboxylate transport system permease small subunit
MFGKIDRAYYRLEKMLVVASLLVMSLIVFLDVAHRRLASPDSTITGLLIFPKKLSQTSAIKNELFANAPAPKGKAQIKIREGKISGALNKRLAPTRKWLDESVSPIALGLLLYWLVLFALRTSVRDQDENMDIGRGTFWLASLAAAAACALLARFDGGTHWVLLCCVGLAGTILSIFSGRNAPVFAAGALSSGIALLAKLMVVAESHWTYIAVVALCAMGVIKVAWKNGKKAEAGLAAFVAFVLSYLVYVGIPEGFDWGTEVSIKVLLLWVGFLGTSMSAHKHSHIVVDFVRKLVPNKVRPVYDGISYLVAAGFGVLLTYLGYLYVFGTPTCIYAMEATLPLSDAPSWWGVAAIPIGLATTSVRFLGVSFAAFRGDLPVAASHVPTLPEDGE